MTLKWSSTATNGYEQSETFISLPNTIFQLVSVSSTFAADSLASTYVPTRMINFMGMLAWEYDPKQPQLSLLPGSPAKLAGRLPRNVPCKILTVPGAPLTNPEPLSTLVYDFSGSSYHYNADFGVSTRFAQVVSPATITKSFSPNTVAANKIPR